MATATRCPRMRWPESGRFAFAMPMRWPHWRFHRTAVVSCDGTLFAGQAGECVLGVQRAVEGDIIYRFTSEKGMTEGIVFSPDNRWLAAADRDGNTIIWDLRTGKAAHRFKAKPVEVLNGCCHAFTPDGTIFIQARADGVAYWDVRTGKEIRRTVTESEGEWPSKVIVSPNGELAAIHFRNSEIDIRDIKTGRLVRTFGTHCNRFGGIFTHDGTRLITANVSGVIEFWHVETGKCTGRLTSTRNATPSSLALSPDGKILAAGGSDHIIHLWDLETSKEIPRNNTKLGGRPTARFLRDGQTVLVECIYAHNGMFATINDKLTFWDLQGNLLRESSLTPERAHAHRFTGDADIVAYGNGPNFRLMARPVPNGHLKSSITLFDTASGKELVRVDEVPCQIHVSTFSTDDRYLIVNASNAGPNPDDYPQVDAVQIWRKSPAALVKVADIPTRYFLYGYGVAVGFGRTRRSRASHSARGRSIAGSQYACGPSARQTAQRTPARSQPSARWNCWNSRIHPKREF